MHSIKINRFASTAYVPRFNNCNELGCPSTRSWQFVKQDKLHMNMHKIKPSWIWIYVISAQQRMGAYFMLNYMITWPKRGQLRRFWWPFVNCQLTISTGLVNSAVTAPFDLAQCPKPWEGEEFSLQDIVKGQKIKLYRRYCYGSG